MRPQEGYPTGVVRAVPRSCAVITDGNLHFRGCRDVPRRRGILDFGRRIRLVLDTYVAVSGLLWHGSPGKLIDAAQAGSLTLYTSAPLLAELHGVLARETFTKHLQDRELTATQILEDYAALTTVVVPAIITPVIIEDPDDDAVLACAVAAKVDLVVSGDPHLVKLAQYEGIPIVTPAEAVERLHL